VNHIVGYSELLMDEASERQLDAFVPALRQVREKGMKLLELIEDAFQEQTLSEKSWEGAEFKQGIESGALEMSRILASVDADLERGHRETQADLAAITGAVRRLTDLAIPSGNRPSAVESFPARAPRFEDLPREMSPVSSQRGSGIILIADDDDANRDLLRRRLLCEGHEVLEARNGRDALDLLKNHACDLVLLDILMPVMDGLRTLARIKQDPRLRMLPVIMISALGEFESVVRCIEMGAVDYLPKPFNRVLLRARIGASLERKRLTDRERRKTEELERTLTLLEAAQEQLSLQATHDMLTGLVNRRSIETQLEGRIRRGDPFTAIYIDLNGFKKINDDYGHATGDELLQHVGERLRSAFRFSDAIGRWGGDEFVAFVDAGEAQQHMTRVKMAMMEDFELAAVPERVAVGAAVGAATWDPGESASDLLQRADFAMYEEKLRRR
jgi:diguanylate cyclase (GGDEF)-like protein